MEIVIPVGENVTYELDLDLSNLAPDTIIQRLTFTAKWSTSHTDEQAILYLDSQLHPDKLFQQDGKWYLSLTPELTVNLTPRRYYSSIRGLVLIDGQIKVKSFYPNLYNVETDDPLFDFIISDTARKQIV